MYCMSTVGTRVFGASTNLVLDLYSDGVLPERRFHIIMVEEVPYTAIL